MEEALVKALFVGRFQPFHLGHGEVVRTIMREVDELIIVIGSSQKSHELENPFTTGERISMIKAALLEMRVDPLSYYIIPVPDAAMHSCWTSKVMSYCPPFHIVYSNQPLTRRLFKEMDVNVKGISMFHRKLYSATEIRRRMLRGEDWRRLLHKGVVRVIEEIKGVQRLRELSETDSPYEKKKI